MSQTCPSCGFENRLTNRFCSNCGTALAQPPPNEGAGTEAGPRAKQSEADYMPLPSAQSPDVSYRVQRWEGAEPPIEPVTPAEQTTFVPPPYSPTAAPQGAVPPPPYAGQYTGSRTPPERTSGPPADMRAEGGTYLPYAQDVVRTLEEKRPERKWLIPVVIGLSVVLLVFVAAAGFLWLGGRDNSAGGTASSGGQVAPTVGAQAPGTPSADCPAPSGVSEEDIIKEVIRRSNDEQIQAWRELNTDVLYCTRIGSVLQENIQAVEQLRSRNMYAVPVNHRLDFGNITINGDQATAETVEEWTVTFYRQADDKMIEKDGPRVLSEVYYLVKQDGKWLISELVIENMPQQQTPEAEQVSAIR